MVEGNWAQRSSEQERKKPSQLHLDIDISLAAAAAATFVLLIPNPAPGQHNTYTRSSNPLLPKPFSLVNYRYSASHILLPRCGMVWCGEIQDRKIRDGTGFYSIHTAGQSGQVQEKEFPSSNWGID